MAITNTHRIKVAGLEGGPEGAGWHTVPEPIEEPTTMGVAAMATLVTLSWQEVILAILNRLRSQDAVDVELS